MAGAGTAAVLGGAGLASASSILNGQNSWSNAIGNSIGDSWGSSIGQSSSYGESNAWSKAKSKSQSTAYNYGDSWGESTSESEEGSESWSQSDSEDWSNSKTYGREASAQDIQNAAEANQIQRDLWQMQADYNAKQAQIDRDYQTHMSNTAYQRAVADLVAAGLNPILAAGNMGASTPVGAMATSGLGTAAKANAYAEQESSGYGYSHSKSEASSWGNSSSRSYSRSHEQGESQSSSNSWSKSKSKSKESSQSSNSSSQGSHNESHESSNSRTKTQAASLLDAITETTKDTIGAVKDIFTGGSAKKQLTNKEKVWGQSTGNKKNRNSKK